MDDYIQPEGFSDLWHMCEFSRGDASAPSEIARRGRASLVANTDDVRLGDVPESKRKEFGKTKFLRGRPLKYKNGENLPGVEVSQDNTMKDLREIMGLGFSNEIIEREFRPATTRKKPIEDEVIKFTMPDLGFKSTSISSAETSPTSYSSLASIESSDPDKLLKINDENFPPIM